VIPLRPVPVLLLALVLASSAGARAGEPAIGAPGPSSKAIDAGGSEPVLDPSDARVRDAIARGIAFLVGFQNEDGSWGSPAPTLTVDIYAPGIGSQRAYQVATSALALCGLLEADDGTEKVAKAVRKGTEWLLRHHDVRRDTPDVIYATWAHAYSLEAFARLLDRERDPARRARLVREARVAVDGLVRYEYVDGGWGYYDFAIGTKSPAHGYSTSFTTATALVGLANIAAQGVPVPERIVQRAIALIRRCRLPGGAYAYSLRLDFRQPWGVNKPEGSLARTPACIASLLAWDESEPEKRIVASLDALEREGGFLRIARKYPVPHETWFQNSGYFCLYGYYYASLLLDRVPEAKREFHRHRIAAHLLPLQEEDGSWWDYQLYRYHKAYGTGFVLMTLVNCLDAAEGP
jgi:hypothetical protein